MKTILLTGGGTAGHVTPNLALIPSLKAAGYDIRYIGSYNGMERKLIENAGIPYNGISSGKLRRYFDLKNFTDPFRVLKGYAEALKLMKKYKPDVLFSKGGFVAVPVVLAAKHYHIPTIIHESDMTPGLANKLCIPSAKWVCCNFPETLKYLPEGKAVLTGSPIRAELLQGDRLAGFVSAPSTRPYPTFPFLPYRSKTTARESPADFQSSTPSFTSTLRFTGVVAVPKVPIFMTLTSAHFASGSSAFRTKSEISAGRQLIVR